MDISLIHSFKIYQKGNKDLNGCYIKALLCLRNMWFCGHLVALISILGQKATFFMSESFIFAESFKPNLLVARNTFDFFHLWLSVRISTEKHYENYNYIDSPKKLPWSTDIAMRLENILQTPEYRSRVERLFLSQNISP